MKQQVVPTSPKSPERVKRDEKRAQRQNAAHPHLVFAVIVAVLIFGTVAGFFGFMIAANVPETLPVIGRFNVVSLFQQERDTILLSSRGAEKSVLTQAPYTIEQVASVYSAAPTVEQPAEFYGNAVVLTSDGWLAMATAALPQNEDDSVTIVLPNEETAEVEARVDDVLSSISFLKVDASELSVVNFDDEYMIPAGKQFSLIEKYVGSYVVYARRAAGEKNIDSTVRSTQKIQQRTVIDGDAEVHDVSSPVFYNSGEFAGVVVAPGTILHSGYIKGALDSVIEKEEVERSALDVEYINISRLTAEEKEERSLPEVGILVTTVNVPEAIELQAGDTILSVNNKPIDVNTDFSALVHSRGVDSSLFMTVLRDGTEQTFEIAL